MFQFWKLLKPISFSCYLISKIISKKSRYITSKIRFCKFTQDVTIPVSKRPSSLIPCLTYGISLSKNDIITDEIAKLFQGKNFAFVATLMKDGSPQITPTWIDLVNNMILVNTAEDRVKHRNIVRDPRVAVSIIDSTNPYNMVTVQGKVIEQTTKGADDHINKLAKKYLGVDKYPSRSPTEKRIIFKIKPDKVFLMK